MGIEKSVRSRTARLRECSSWKSLLHLHDDDKINLLCIIVPKVSEYVK